VIAVQSVGSVVVSPHAGTIAPSDTLQLVAEAFDQNGVPETAIVFGLEAAIPRSHLVRRDALILVFAGHRPDGTDVERFSYQLPSDRSAKPCETDTD